MPRMNHFLLIAAFVVAADSATSLPAEETGKLPPAATRPVDFASDIQPLFKKNCISCHGAE